MSDKFKELYQRSKCLEDRSFRELWTEVVECSELMKELDPNHRRPWLENVIWQMYEEQAGNCALTGLPLEPTFEVDHIIPFYYAGGNERANLRLVNRGANRSRGSRGVNPQDLLRYLQDRYQNR